MKRSVFVLLVVFLLSGCTMTPEQAQKALADIGMQFTANNFIVMCQQGHAREVRLFLVGGMDPNTTDVQGTSALSHAITFQRKRIVELLLKAGADPNTSSNDGWTVLMAASRRGNAGIVELLLEAGADPNRKTEDSQTALQRAEDEGHMHIVELLRENGALD